MSMEQVTEIQAATPKTTGQGTGKKPLKPGKALPQGRTGGAKGRSGAAGAIRVARPPVARGGR